MPSAKSASSAGKKNKAAVHPLFRVDCREDIKRGMALKSKAAKAGVQASRRVRSGKSATPGKGKRKDTPPARSYPRDYAVIIQAHAQQLDLPATQRIVGQLNTAVRSPQESTKFASLLFALNQLGITHDESRLQILFGAGLRFYPGSLDVVAERIASAL